MSNIFAQERGSHWYHPDGTSAHVQPDGKKTTLRHARKQGLLPSVTNILSIIPKHAVEDWRVEQAVLATMQCMSEPGSASLTAQEMKERVAGQLEVNSGVGRKFGTEIHSVIEYVNTNNGDLPPSMSPLGQLHPNHAAAYHRWFLNSGFLVESQEQRFTHNTPDTFYAGCRDLVAIDRDGWRCYIDFKSQAVRNGKPKFYPEWVYQLAAYAAPDMAPHKLISVVIDSGPEATITECEWEADDELHGWEVFCAAAKLWTSMKEYKA